PPLPHEMSLASPYNQSNNNSNSSNSLDQPVMMNLVKTSPSAYTEASDPNGPLLSGSPLLNNSVPPNVMSSMVSAVSNSYSPLYGDLTPTSASSSAWTASTYSSNVSAGQVPNYSLSYHQQPSDMVYSSPAQTAAASVSAAAPSAQQASPQLSSPGHHHGPSNVLASLSTTHQSLPHHSSRTNMTMHAIQNKVSEQAAAAAAAAQAAIVSSAPTSDHHHAPQQQPPPQQQR